MRFILRGITAVAACATLGAARPPQVPAPLSLTALVVTYADGRRAANVVGLARGSFWTPAFPRVEDWQPADGAEKATALQVSYVLAGSDVRAEVSLLYGQPHSSETHVVTTLVRFGQPVEVPELKKFGVQPVTLSLATVDPVGAERPKVAIDFPGLDVYDVAVVSDTVPRYSVTVRNVSSKMARAFSVDAYVANRLTLSGIQKGREGRPVVLPGEGHTFDIRSASGRPAGDASSALAPRPFNLIRIANVLWTDGSFDGDQAWAARQQAVDLGERLQLVRVVAALTHASSEAVSDGTAAIRSFRAAIELLSIVPEDTAISDATARMPLFGSLPPSSVISMCQIGLQNIKTSVLSDLRAFESAASQPAPGVNKVRTWLQGLSDRYGAWLNQLRSY